MKDENNIEWEDIVVTIPKNTVYMTVQAGIFDNSEISQYVGEYNVSEINECRNTLEKYIIGDLPKYVLTKKGREYLNGSV
jgi:hypothetical protein